ncbi:MAG: flavodoxin-dependent (E)-4-hydroxy-3-methylbut-2-enyl-diphosphate synthase, partial [Bacteroidales bacterium]|nr:flavodoxin-dependent (E)-4-hydroxy-3-methylbut-2-enyl-diphosphate synthase [Bacteroidales bacterium]
VISLKSSNVLLMVESNKMLFQQMRDKNCVFPLHLGVTEAGDAEAGRIKSAIGIGVLLAQGIGNTIRVSLTEAPEKEIPVCQKIVTAAHKNPLRRTETPQLYNRRISTKIGIIGGGQPPIVIQNTKIDRQDKAPADFYYDDKKNAIFSLDEQKTLKYCAIEKVSDEKLIEQSEPHEQDGCFINLSYKDWTIKTQKILKSNPHIIIVIERDQSGLKGIQSLINDIANLKLLNPLLLRLEIGEADFESFLVQASVQAGAFLLDGQMDGLWLESDYFKTPDTAFGILQASRQRISKTEYIACPSCGRTLFNIQEKLQEIKGLSIPFKKLKIAVMGCKVNGLGEMADADYGYVGSGMGKVDIYKGKTLILSKVDEAIATQKLLEIIISTS